MTVWLVFMDDGERENFVKVVSSRELAQKYADAENSKYTTMRWYFQEATVDE